MQHNGVTSKAKEVAEKEVLKRVTTLEQAKANYKDWIKTGLSQGGFDRETVDFWAEVSRQVDLIPETNTGKSGLVQQMAEATPDRLQSILQGALHSECMRPCDERP